MVIPRFHHVRSSLQERSYFPHPLHATYTITIATVSQVLLGIILLLGFTKGVDINDMSFTMVEYFSGKGNVSGMFKKDPIHRVATFELKDSKAMDMNSSAGFAFLPMHVLM